MTELDVRGLSCPEPVLRLKEELDKGSKEIKMLVNEAHTVKNIKKFCESAGKEIHIIEKDLEYELEIK